MAVFHLDKAEPEMHIRTARGRATLAIAAALIGVGAATTGPADAASAGSTTPAHRAGYVTDALGTHRAGLAAGGGPVASATCAHSSYGGGFNTSLGGSWSSLTERSAPCRAASATGAHTTGSTWYVYNESQGEFICQGRSSGVGSSIWYNSGKPRVDPWEWSWSGGTSDPQWNRSC